MAIDNKRMNKVKRQPADDGEIQFELIAHEINLLMRRFAAKRICPCCVGREMMHAGAFLHQQVAGTEATVELCMEVADMVEQPDDDAIPAGNTQH